MLLEFDADQRLWQETVRDAVTKACPASLVRGIAENGVDPTPLWKTYVDAGWTELADPENAVELAIVAEELGLTRGADVVLQVRRGRLEIRIGKGKSYRPEDLIRRIRKSNLHGAVEFGPPVGRELL